MLVLLREESNRHQHNRSPSSSSASPLLCPSASSSSTAPPTSTTSFITAVPLPLFCRPSGRCRYYCPSATFAASSAPVSATKISPFCLVFNPPVLGFLQSSSSTLCVLSSIFGTLLLMTSLRARGPRKNKRQWNEEEDNDLIDAIKDIVSNGTFKADNGFKPGFLMAVEEKLKSKLPNSGLKAQQFINSRLQHFRFVHAIVYDMLTGPNTFELGWDPEMKTVSSLRDL